MPHYTPVNLHYVAYCGGKSVFVDRGSFVAEAIRKDTLASESPRQAHFEYQLEQLSAAVQSRSVPVFIGWRNTRNRMDVGCIGHSLARGYIADLIRDQFGSVTHVTLDEIS